MGPAAEVQSAFGGHAEGALVERGRVVGHDVDAGELLHELDAEGEVEALVGGDAVGAEEVGPGSGVGAFEVDGGLDGGGFGEDGWGRGGEFAETGEDGDAGVWVRVGHEPAGCVGAE